MPRIIPKTSFDVEETPWKTAYAQVVTDPRELLSLLELDCLADQLDTNTRFTMRVPHEFIKRMKKGDAADPLLRQVLPVISETRRSLRYPLDPLDELQQIPQGGVVHKYPGRILLMPTGACAIHCRYCFRRNFPYQDNILATQDWRAIKNYLRADPNIHEVILSGGDPLTWNDAAFAQFGEQLKQLPQIKTLRIHTRLPVVIPQRITREFVTWLNEFHLPVVIVLHINHPNEIDHDIGTRLSLLKNSGVTLLNQSVLLRGVNDDAATQIALSQKLFSVGVLPYYVHQLDKVQGSQHFYVGLNTAKSILRAVRAALPGYLVPKLVWEKPGEKSKTWIHF